MFTARVFHFLPYNVLFVLKATNTNSSTGAILGIVTASFNIGAVSGIPLIPFFNDRYGRKFCVVFGSVLISIGVIIQTAAINSWSLPQLSALV